MTGQNFSPVIMSIKEDSYETEKTQSTRNPSAAYTPYENKYNFYLKKFSV
ncbi:hypothetical protein J2Z40_000230 [Cytobacillus eiseniae]|uniref:Uncharacterized protein n=1 Tax=Cytobacillus eiseniae TaxID=762947 RepID=A0ABS4R9X3_9BACI|nr:hypothetical protein [Cytobacillus eiseniae]